MNIIDDIGLVTVFLLVFLSLFLLATPSKNKLPNIFFALFLLVTSLDISALFLQDIFIKYPFINKIRVSSVLLQMPLFYFYVKTICYHNFRLKPSQLAHSLLFFVFLILFSVQTLTNENLIYYKVVTQLQYYSYIFSIFYILVRYKTLHLENYSLQNKTYQWLMTTSVLFLVGNCFVLFRTMSQTLYDYEEFALLNLGISLFGLGVICWFMLKTMRNPELFNGIDKDIQPLTKGTIEEKGKYQKEIDHITQYMVTEKPYLEEALTLQTLAQKIGIPEKELSFLINKVIGKHFFDFINTYRIQEATTLLQDKTLNIQEIMYTVGFNSKSSFNTAFKKHTLTTPSNYRKSNT